MLRSGAFDKPIRCASAIVLVIVSALVATSCGNTSDDVRTVEVNALWYGVNQESGESQGGVTPVLIRFSARSNELDIDVADQKSSGAGSQWVAASWLGATTSLLDHTVDPATVRLMFEISESIDGPSAGALMAVGVAAALRGDSIHPRMAMTGTIEVDGSIGGVGGLPQKVKGAASAGVETVLIPSGQRTVQASGSGDLVDLVDMGTELGVTVREVDDIAQAYQVMTGKELDGADLAPVSDPLTDSFEKKLQVLTRNRLKALETTMKILDDRQPRAADPASNWFQRAIDAQEEAKRAAASGDSTVAYESAMTASLVAQQALSTMAVKDAIRAQGAASVRDQILSRAQRLDDRARKTTRDLASSSEFSEPARALAFGDALAWVTTGGLVAFLTANSLEASSAKPALLKEAGAALARSEIYFESSRDALVLLNELRGVGKPAETNHVAVADLMWEAGSASLAYLDDVVLNRISGDTPLSTSKRSNFLESPDSDYVYVTQSEAYLEKLVEGLNASAAATVKSAVALERYVYTAYLIAKYETLQSSLDIDGYVSGPGNSAQLDEYVTLAQEHLDELMSETAAVGIDTSYLYLLAEWGTSRHSRGKASGNALDETYALAFLWRAFVIGQIHRLVSG